MVNGHDAVGIICLTAGSGRYAVLACKNKIPCTLVAMTQEHKELVLAYIERLIFNEFQVEGGPLHQAGLVEVLSKEKKKVTPKAKPTEKTAKKLNSNKKEAEPETPKPTNSAMEDLKRKLLAFSGEDGEPKPMPKKGAPKKGAAKSKPEPPTPVDTPEEEEEPVESEDSEPEEEEEGE
eukprot:4172479-Lingulodinium_polyedra.AAC.1